MTSPAYQTTNFHKYLDSLSETVAQMLVQNFGIRSFSKLLDFLGKNLLEIHQNKGQVSRVLAIGLLVKMEPFMNPSSLAEMRHWDDYKKKEIRRVWLLQELSKPQLTEPLKLEYNLQPRAKKSPIPSPPKKEPTRITHSALLMNQYSDGCPICMSKMPLDQLTGHIFSVHMLEKVNCLYCGAVIKHTNLAGHLLAKHHGELGDGFQTVIYKRSTTKKEPIQPLRVGVDPVTVLGKSYRVLEDAEGVVPTFEKFCRAIPPEMVDLLQEWKLSDFESLIKYMRKRRDDIYKNSGNIMVDEAVMLLNRMKSLEAEIPISQEQVHQIRRLLEYLSISPKLDRVVLTKGTSRYKCPCPICGKVYALEWLIWHMKVSHTRGIIQCPFCSNHAKIIGLIKHLSSNHKNKMLPVYAVMELTTEDKESTKQPPVIQTAVEDDPPEPKVLFQSRLTQLREFRPIRRTCRARRVKIAVEYGDQRSFVSQAARVKTERASRIHANVLAILWEHLITAGVEVSETFLIDAFAEFQGPNIFEVKSIDDANERSQIRHAVAQLYEYRYIYGLRDARLWLVLSRQPVTSWVLDYLVSDRNIAVLWVQEGCLAGPLMGKLSKLLAS